MCKWITRESNSAFLQPWLLWGVLGHCSWLTPQSERAEIWARSGKYKVAPVSAAQEALTFPFFHPPPPYFFHCNSECIFARYPWNYYYYIAILDQCSGNTLQIVMAFTSWCLPYCLVESSLIPRLKCLFHFSKAHCLLPLHKRLPI